MSYGLLSLYSLRCKVAQSHGFKRHCGEAQRDLQIFQQRFVL